MRWMLVLLVVVAGVLLATQIGPRPTTRSLAETAAHWDIELRACREFEARFSDGRNSWQRELTLCGPADRILAPWLTVQMETDRLRLAPLGGKTITVPAAARTAWWRPDGWQFSDEPLSVRELPRATPDPARQLPRWLQRERPQSAELIARIWPELQPR